MKEKAFFLNMFSDYEPPETLKEALHQAAIVAADIDPARRMVFVRAEFESYVTQRALEQVRRGLCGVYGLADVVIDPVYAPALLEQMDTEDLMQLFVQHNSMARAVLAGAQWNWAGSTLTIGLAANGKQILLECLPQVRSALKNLFCTDVDIAIESDHVLEGQALFDAIEKMRSEMIEEMPVPQVAPKKAEEKSECIYGKPFKTAPVSMKTVSLDMGSVVVEGKVFAVNHRELKKRNAWIVSFDMTDNTGSVRVKRFLENREAKGILEQVKEGCVLRVQGKMTVDKFDNEVVMTPYAIMPGQMAKRVDSAEGMKRVELHLHTSMSNMDALTDAAVAVKQAAAWGHRAIAITDHGVAQAFPIAMKAAEKATVAGTDEKIKVLYGVEGYYFNDVDDRIAVHGAADMSFDDEYVAFDLETTGLDARNDQIIEIGAVLMKNGQEISRFQTFVDPHCSLSRKVSELTGISQNMLNGAPDISAALPEFLEFVGQRVLVAHNADFDTGFIRAACKRLGYDYQFTDADTLILSQNLMPQLKRFSLDQVAAALSLPEFNHHRAADDALTCGMVFGRLLEKLKEQYQLNTLQSIIPLMAKLRGERRTLSRYNQHIIVLAKNQQGLRNLYRMISESNLTYFKRGFPRMPKSRIQELREGLIIGSACEAGEFFQAVLEHKSDEELKRIASFYDFLEIQPVSNNRFMLAEEHYNMTCDEDLQELNKTVVRIADELGKPVVATGDVHFLNPEDEIFRHILLATKGFSDCDRDNPLYFRTTDDMLEEFSYLGAEKAYEVVVANPNRIADMCERLRAVPKNLFAPKIENSVEDLKELVYGKFHRLYGENPPELMVKRVETELNDIINCHYDVIYMSAQRLVQNSLEHGYLVGSRGSVGSSIVAYMSGITEVNSFPPHYRCPNPECKHTILDVPEGYNCGADLPNMECPMCGTPMEKDGFNIPFETFLGFGGDKVPDIDLNFSGEYQANAHNYCIEMFGKSHVFRAGTIGTVAEKTAFGYVKKYLEERGKTETAAEMARLASGCVGVRRTTGQHPGGLVVIPQDNEIWDFCPVQHPADAEDSDQITTHFEYHCMEDNLLKLDMLGHDDPTMIRMMEDITGVDAKTIPLDDPDTMSIFTKSKVLGYENDQILGPTGAVGVPEFNTRFTRGVLLDTMPKKFDFLVRISGYTHGTDVWLGNAKDLITSGKTDVGGTIGCRDDIMLYLISMGLPEKRAFKIMESVRKGRGLPDGAEQEMIDAGVPDWYIESCKKIKYLFPKAHAVAYVMMAFRIAWFKVHHPLAFYSAYFYRRSQKGGFDEAKMGHGMDIALAEMDSIENNENATDKDEDLLITLEVAYEYYLRGFEFLPLDIYKSHATKFLVEDGKLRLPFISVAGLGESAAWDLMHGREGKSFLSIEEIAAACPKVSKTHIQMLKEAGAFGALPETSQISLF